MDRGLGPLITPIPENCLFEIGTIQLTLTHIKFQTIKMLILTTPKLKGNVFSKCKTTQILHRTFLYTVHAIDAFLEIPFHVHKCSSIVHVATHMAGYTHHRENDLWIKRVEKEALWFLKNTSIQKIKHESSILLRY